MKFILLTNVDNGKKLLFASYKDFVAQEIISCNPHTHFLTEEVELYRETETINGTDINETLGFQERIVFPNVDETTNILMNMSSGLLPQSLTQHECELVEERLGKNWFEDLGYDNDEMYSKPCFAKPYIKPYPER